jgi:hypothetical protein
VSVSVSVDDLPPDAFRDEVWCELLPWLSQYSAGTVTELSHLSPAADWWLTESPAVTSTVVAMSRIRKAIAQLAVSDMGDVPLGRVVPFLNSATRMESLRLGSRAMTTLTRMSVETLGDLGAHTVGDLFDVRGTGIGTVVEIVEGLVAVAVLRSSRQETAPASGAPQAEPTLSAAEMQLVEDLRQLAAWRTLRGETELPLLGPLTLEPLAPEDVQETVQRLLTITPADLATPTFDDPVDTLTRLTSDLDHRHLVVLRERFAAAAPRALAELGVQFGVSRERARQIEVAAKGRIAAAFEDRSVARLLASMRVEIQPVCALDRLTSRHPDLTRVVPPFEAPLWLVLDRLDDYFEVTDGWAAAPSVDDARERTRELLEDFADEHGVVDVATVTLGGNMPARELTDWLSWCGYLVEEDRVLTKTRSAADHAAGVLSLSAQPLDIEELVRRMGATRSAGTVSNALGSDERFVRTDRATWALASWGVEAYTSIRDQVARAVDAAGGSLPLDELVQDLTSRFTVAASSVISYSSSGAFEVRDGLVLRRETAQQAPQKSPSDTRRLFRSAHGWRFRLLVNRDHLRGSGFTVPSGVGTVAKCRPGDAVELPTRLGAQNFRWTGNQPNCGTIRRFLDALGTTEGDQVWLEFRDDGWFDVRPFVTGEAELPDLHAALLLVGADEEPVAEQASAALATAVGLPAEAPPRRVLRAYRDRGDDDVVGLLERAWLNPRPR